MTRERCCGVEWNRAPGEHRWTASHPDHDGAEIRLDGQRWLLVHAGATSYHGTWELAALRLARSWAGRSRCAEV